LRASALSVLDPSVPTAIVQGGSDTVVPPGNAEALARFHPGATVTMLPDCAHAPMAQEPAAAAEAIIAAAGV
jgi:pimeloyl-ACP methyl ester carboxylesterase